MAQFFADKAAQDTRGGRGRTTRRTGTRTVRGCEGAWIASVKEELAARPAGWVVWEERLWSVRWQAEPLTRAYQIAGFDTEAEAAAFAASRPTGPATLFRGPNGDNYVSRVWVEREAK